MSNRCDIKYKLSFDGLNPSEFITHLLATEQCLWDSQKVGLPIALIIINECSNRCVINISTVFTELVHRMT